MMAKISGILPSNRRITSTDIQNERPIRPGAPSFGQPVATTANSRDEFQPVTLSESDIVNYRANAKLDSVLGTGENSGRLNSDRGISDETLELPKSMSSGLDVRA